MGCKKVTQLSRIFAFFAKYQLFTAHQITFSTESEIQQPEFIIRSQLEAKNVWSPYLA